MKVNLSKPFVNITKKASLIKKDYQCFVLPRLIGTKRLKENVQLWKYYKNYFIFVQSFFLSLMHEKILKAREWINKSAAELEWIINIVTKQLFILWDPTRYQSFERSLRGIKRWIVFARILFVYEYILQVNVTPKLSLFAASRDENIFIAPQVEVCVNNQTIKSIEGVKSTFLTSVLLNTAYMKKYCDYWKEFRLLL